MRTPSSPDPADRAAQRLALLAAAIEGRSAVADPPDESAGGGVADATAPWWADHTRVRRPGGEADATGPARAVDDPAPAVAEPTVVPEPGRHATRRRETELLAALRERLPATGVVAAQHLTVVALAVAVVIGGTAWWLLRDRGSGVPLPVASTAAPLTPVDGVTTTAVPVPTSATGAADASLHRTVTPSAGASVTVDVVGKVRRPGIAVLPAGARVVDALRAAGGARHGVDLTSLNLARPLVDGEQIAVGVAGAAGAAAPAAADAGGGGAAAPPGGLVNLNTATEQQLEALPEVGPVTAQAIVAYRQQNGGFTSVDQLLDVQGIGDKTMAQLQPYVTV